MTQTLEPFTNNMISQNREIARVIQQTLPRQESFKNNLWEYRISLRQYPKELLVLDFFFDRRFRQWWKYSYKYIVDEIYKKTAIAICEKTVQRATDRFNRDGVVYKWQDQTNNHSCNNFHLNFELFNKTSGYLYFENLTELREKISAGNEELATHVQHNKSIFINNKSLRKQENLFLPLKQKWEQEISQKLTPLREKNLKITDIVPFETLSILFRPRIAALAEIANLNFQEVILLLSYHPSLLDCLAKQLLGACKIQTKTDIKRRIFGTLKRMKTANYNFSKSLCAFICRDLGLRMKFPKKKKKEYISASVSYPVIVTSKSKTQEFINALEKEIQIAKSHFEKEIKKMALTRLIKDLKRNYSTELH